VVPRIGDGLGFGTWLEPPAVGLPLLMGTTSGIVCDGCAGGENTAPTVGGEATCASGDGNCWLRRDSDCVRPA
jgi:hypothetical protein